MGAELSSATINLLDASRVRFLLNYLPCSPPSPIPIARVLFNADLVNSTSVTERVGDSAWAQLSEQHDTKAREVFSRHGGWEVDKTDGFLVVFERPIDAVRAAFDYHALFRASGALHDAGLMARVGIHFAEVIIRQNPAEQVANGAKPYEVEGLAKPVVGRLMSLAEGGQTLLGRAAFDMARRASVGTDAMPPKTMWLAHGSYEMRENSEAFEVFEVGIEGISPPKPPVESPKVRRVLAAGEAETLSWRPAAGLGIPHRKNWVLRDKLGQGGFGEVWLAEQKKTRNRRVFKFCFDSDHLRALKREVTLFRLLKEKLGDREDIARVIDWNFEGSPYFIEGDYTQGGDVSDWVQRQGGLEANPLATRLELIAQAAEALAAAHSVGILHKDIKPSNILVYQDVHGNPKARLTDFGIGVITDRSRLGIAGVTDTGLTESQLTGNESSRTGTRLFMAPELLEGKTATIRATSMRWA